VPSILGLLALAIVALALLIWREQRAASPLLPLSLLRQPSIWRCDALAACHGAALVSLITFMPMYLIVVRGISAAQVGLMLLPLMIGIGAGSMVTGRMVAVSGRTAIFPSSGLVLVTLNLLLLALFVSDLGVGLLVLFFFWNGLCMGTVMGVVQVTVQYVSGASMLGEAAASVQFSRSIGAALGTAVVAAVLFAVLAATDRETAAMFGSMLEQGGRIVQPLSPERQAIVQAEVAQAFRAAFLIIAGFTALGAWLAASIPLRRI
jgi:predicted MFS family arabinose efflux permease